MLKIGLEIKASREAPPTDASPRERPTSLLDNQQFGPFEADRFGFAHTVLSVGSLSGYSPLLLVHAQRWSRSRLSMRCCMRARLNRCKVENTENYAPSCSVHM